MSFSEAVQDRLNMGFPWRRGSWGVFFLNVLCMLGRQNPFNTSVPPVVSKALGGIGPRPSPFFLSEMHMVDTVTWHKMRGG